MAPFFKNRPFLITVIVVIILILLMVLTSGSNTVGGQSVVGGIISKVQVFFYDATNAVGDFFSGIFGGRDVDKENVQLRQQVSELTEDTKAMAELKAENERLKELLSFQEKNSEFLYATARVVAKEPGNWFESFTINAGRNQGIAVGMAVVNQDGLVGRISEVSGSWSKVTCIIDSRSSISALLQRSRCSGIVKGETQADTKDAHCQLVHLPYETDMLPGDKVITSGLNGILPKGILIGEIQEVPVSSSSSETYAVVKPAVDFTGIEEVMVIIGNKED